MKNKLFGFSLVELMIVVAIIGILAAVAVPSYKNAVLRGKRAEGRTALLNLMQQQERYMTQRNCYLGFSTTASGAATASDPKPATACGGVRAANVPFKVFSGENLSNSAYLLSAEPCPLGDANLSIAECVRVVATPRITNSDPEADVLRLTSSGFRDCTGTKPEVCWK